MLSHRSQATACPGWSKIALAYVCSLHTNGQPLNSRYAATFSALRLGNGGSGTAGLSLDQHLVGNCLQFLVVRALPGGGAQEVGDPAVLFCPFDE